MFVVVGKIVTFVIFVFVFTPSPLMMEIPPMCLPLGGSVGSMSIIKACFISVSVPQTRLFLLFSFSYWLSNCCPPNKFFPTIESGAVEVAAMCCSPDLGNISSA